jgi:hypothetical protein
MSAAPARHSERAAPRRRRTSGPVPADRARTTGDRSAARRRVSAERRRRQRHFARRRRDLTEDGAVALVISLALIVLTAGLGVLALFMMLLATLIAGSVIVPRAIARRRARTSTRGSGRRRDSGARARAGRSQR